MKKKTLTPPEAVPGQCRYGAVRFEIDYPARWAWHDHTQASRLAHGAAYATYIGSWRKRFRVTAGEADIARYEDVAVGTTRSFCRCCGTPLLYDYFESKHINLTTGSFDDPSRFAPRFQFGLEARLPVFADLPIQAEGTTEETMADLVAAIAATNHQHPDHDTESWPE